MKKLLVIIFLYNLLQSCNSDVNKNAFLTLSFSDTIFVKPEILKTDKLLSAIWSVRILDSMLILLSDDGNGCLQAFNKSNFKYLYTKGIYGRGPNEVTSSMIEFKCIRDTIYLYDISKNSLFIYNINQFINDSLSASKKTIQFYNKIHNFDVFPLREHFVIRPIKDARYTVTNYYGKMTSNYFSFPDYYMNDNKVQLNFERRKYFYVEPKPDLSKFVSITYIGGTIEIFNVINDSINKIIEKRYLDPNLNKDPSKSLNQDETNIGFCSLCVTDSYIYAAYSGLPNKKFKNTLLADYIIVFDWNGEAKKIYKVDGGLIGLAVDEPLKRIFIITRDSENNDAIGLINM